jgi:signal transduction histidine kinase
LVLFDPPGGVSSDAVHGIAEGRAGVIYAATGRGLDVLRPVGTGFEPAAVDLGFDTGQVRDVAVERERLWMASANGVYWHDLGAPAPGDGAPHVFVTRLTVRGTEWPIPERGLQRVSGLVFEPDADHLQIEFLAPHIGMPSPRYQHRLGPGHEWSALTAAHAVTLTGLRPDHYAFEVRAVTASGTASAPAVMEFELLAPVWQRWWFRGALVLLAVAAAAAGHRFRLRQVLALERVRSQIAADLHDDIGSRLAEMAVVSELGARDGDRPSRDRFAQLAATARDVRQTMSDVVWAIDPRRDHLIDLVGRTRQAAEALLTTEVGFRLNLPSPEAMQHVTLGLDQRRQIVLLVREALVNVQKHANATSVVITFSVQDATLTIVVEDDGVGIDRARPTDGYGIVSMERRAAALGGRLAIASRPEGGTTLTLTVPLDLGWWGTRRMNG